VRMAPIAALGLIGILLAAPSASGQAAIDQYVPSGNPAGTEGPVSSSGGAAGSLDLGGAGGNPSIAAQAESGSSSGGTLPLTSYPATPFVWVLLALVGTGALVRVAAPMLGRRRAQSA
jgi:hypothetical protein